MSSSNINRVGEIVTTEWHEELSNGELRARLVQRGLEDDAADWLVRWRDLYHDQISLILESE
jgi:hypothetical protein